MCVLAKPSLIHLETRRGAVQLSLRAGGVGDADEGLGASTSRCAINRNRGNFAKACESPFPRDFFLVTLPVLDDLLVIIDSGELSTGRGLLITLSVHNPTLPLRYG